jgi:hypothetical protein
VPARRTPQPAANRSESVGVAKEKIVSKLNRAEVNTLMTMLVVVIFGLLNPEAPMPTLVFMFSVFFIALYGFNSARSDEPTPHTYPITPVDFILFKDRYLSDENDEDDDEDDEYYYGRNSEILR